MLERAREAGLGGRASSREPLRGLGRAAGMGGKRDQHRAVGVVDLPGAERLARGPELIAGRQHRDPRPAGDGQLGRGRRRRRRPSSAAPSRAGRQDRTCRRACPRPRRGCSGRRDGGGDRDRVSRRLGVLLADHRGRARRGRPRRSRSGPPRRRRRGDRSARRRATRRRPSACGRPGRGSDRVAVHRRAGERRHVSGRGAVLREDAIEASSTSMLLGLRIQGLRGPGQGLGRARSRSAGWRCQRFGHRGTLSSNRRARTEVTTDLRDKSSAMPHGPPRRPPRSASRRRPDRRAAAARRGSGQGLAAGVARAGAAP